MHVRIPLTVGAVATVAAALAVGMAPAALATPAVPAAAACRPSITVLPLPPWAKGGNVDAVAAGVAVGSVTVAGGTTRAMRWQRAGSRWLLRPIPGVAALGSVSSGATGVNRHGAITVSVYRSDTTAPRAFVAAGGVLQPLLDGVGGTAAYAADISDSGRVVGSAESAPQYLQVPVRWDYWDQVPRGLGYGSLFYSTTATAIDANDDIAGGYTFGPHWGGGAFRVNGDGEDRTLANGPSSPGSPATAVALDLNSSERTVGSGTSLIGTGAVVWDGGVQTMLPRFAGGSPYTPAVAAAVNEAGVVVGYEDERFSSETPLVRHVLYYTDSGGVMSLLPPSTRWTDPATANAVDEAGTVYGSGYSTSLSQHPGEMVPTAWTCAAAQAFTPTATGVPASAPVPDVVREAV